MLLLFSPTAAAATSGGPTKDERRGARRNSDRWDHVCREPLPEFAACSTATLAAA